MLLLLGGYSQLCGQSNWSKVYSTTDSTQYFGLVHAVDQQRVWFTSDRGLIYSSSNAAADVTPYQIPDNLSLQLSIDFADAEHGFIGGGCWFVTPECEANIVLHTTDGGQTWIKSALEYSLGVMAHLKAFPNGSALALGDYAGLYRFDPATELWDSLGRPSPVANSTHIAMQFPTPTRGYVLQSVYENNAFSYQLLGTQNGGESWSILPVSFVLDPLPVRKMVFLNELQGLFFINGEKLYRTDNGGLTLSEQPFLNHDETVLDVQFVDQQTGYVITCPINSNGKIYRTDDGGLSWALDFVFEEGCLGSLHMVDKNNGYAISYGGATVYKRSGVNSTGQAPAPAVLGIAPHPATDVLRIQLSGATDTPLQIFDGQGRHFYSATAAGSSVLEIACGHWPRGIYLWHCGGQSGKIVLSGK